MLEVWVNRTNLYRHFLLKYQYKVVLGVSLLHMFPRLWICFDNVVFYLFSILFHTYIFTMQSPMIRRHLKYASYHYFRTSALFLVVTTCGKLSWRKYIRNILFLQIFRSVYEAYEIVPDNLVCMWCLFMCLVHTCLWKDYTIFNRYCILSATCNIYINSENRGINDL